MLDIFFSSQFKRDYKLAKRQGRDIGLLLEIIDTLAQEKPLLPKHKDHALSGDLNGHRECHLQPDWMLIYKIDSGQLLLTLTRTGTHSDLFGK